MKWKNVLIFNNMFQLLAMYNLFVVEPLQTKFAELADQTK